MANKRLLYTICVLIALLIIAMLVITSRKKEVEQGTSSDAPVVMPGTDTFDSSNPILIHSFDRGIHTYEATVEIPTPCHVLTEPGVRVMESYPEQFAIALIIAEPDPSVMCDQVTQKKTITMTATASAEAKLQLFTINGMEVPIQLIEK